MQKYNPEAKWFFVCLDAASKKRASFKAWEIISIFVFQNVDAMNYLANKPFLFSATNCEIWSKGARLSETPVQGLIKVALTNGGINITIDGIPSLGLQNDMVFLSADESTISSNAIQYNCEDGKAGFSFPNACKVFHHDRTIYKISFPVKALDREYVFLGTAISFDGMERPESLRFKGVFIDDLATLYRTLLMGNTITVTIIVHQIACVAFALKKYYDLLTMIKDPDGSLKSQVFKDTSSLIYEFYPIFGGPALGDAKSWYDELAGTPERADAFLEYFYGRIKAGQSINPLETARRYFL